MITTVSIDLVAHTGETLADKVRRAGQARALAELAKDVETAAKDDLQTEVDAEARRTGAGFSAKVDGIRASLSDPQNKPHVTDHDAFAQWWVGQGMEHDTSVRVDIFDHELAAQLLAMLAHRSGNRLELAELAKDAMTSRNECVLPAKPMDQLTETGRCVATEDGLIDTHTGELVPGVGCTTARQTLSITPDKSAKARDAAMIRSYFGIPAELGGGA